MVPRGLINGKAISLKFPQGYVKVGLNKLISPFWMWLNKQSFASDVSGI